MARFDKRSGKLSATSRKNGRKRLNVRRYWICTQSFVGASLLAIAVCQSPYFALNHRNREQARSHRGNR